MKKSLTTFASVAVSALILAGCLVPERFSAKITIQPDASYTFRYAGTAVHALAAAQIKQAGSLAEKDEKGLRVEAEKLSRNADVQKAVYKGNGRYELEIEAKRKSGQTLRLLDIFSVNTDKQGVMTIASTEIGEKGKSDLMQLGIKIDGTLDVSLPKNAEVISHNATSTPTFGFGSYSWKIGGVDQRPMMKIRFKS